MAQSTLSPKVSLLLTGSELMSGDTIDSNSSMIAKSLLDLGIEVSEKVTVGDDFNLIKRHLLRLTGEHDLIIVNGGLGPTQDDLTTEILASAANVPLLLSPQAERHVTSWCEKRGFTANDANMKQANLPESATMFPEPPGSAPAFYMTINHCIVIATPGVPSELSVILEKDIMPMLMQLFDMEAKANPWIRYQLFGIGESGLQQKISQELPAINHSLEIGFRANFPCVELKYKKRTTCDVNAESQLASLIEPYIVGPNDATLAQRLVGQAKTANLKLATAESCTGGMIASEITKIPGASDVFECGIVSYSNTIKNQVLNVPNEIFDQHGAVSEPCVLAMLEGALQVSGADIGVSVSGIAGPSGGSKDKPAGTVWLAFGNKEKQLAVCLFIPFPRQQFQVLATAIALDLLYRASLDEVEVPIYLERWMQKDR